MKPCLPPTLPCTLLAAALALALATAPARAVIVLDPTWARSGGSEEEPWAGFGAAKALAARPQFAATVAFAANDGEEGWGACSGTWIGNAGGRGYVLTAAHCFGADAAADDYVYRSAGGTVHEGESLLLHPEWIDTTRTTGYDLAIVTLATPVLDAGPAPLLYGGRAEHGQLLTFVGFGSRGIGSVGQADDYYDDEGDAAAAQGLVEVVEDCSAAAADRGCYLGTFLASPDGSVENPYGGPATPPTRHAGLLGSGDSGGPAFLQSGSRWLLAGVNSNGTGNAQYGDTSWFVRLSVHREWLRRHAPPVRFGK